MPSNLIFEQLCRIVWRSKPVNFLLLAFMLIVSDWTLIEDIIWNLSHIRTANDLMSHFDPESNNYKSLVPSRLDTCKNYNSYFKFSMELNPYIQTLLKARGLIKWLIKNRTLVNMGYQATSNNKYNMFDGVLYLTMVKRMGFFVQKLLCPFTKDVSWVNRNFEASAQIPKFHSFEQ